MSKVHAFFDFDDTLWDGDSILFWLRFYYGQKPWMRIFLILNWIGLLLYLLRLVNSHTLKRIFLYPMGLENPEVLDRMAMEFVDQEMAFRFNVPVLQRLWTHHLLGHKIVIISASAIFYLRHLKKLLPMADIQGSEMLWQKPWTLALPRYRDGNLRGENKITRLRALGYGEAGKGSFAYSDHDHDIYLLNFSEFPFCVRPTAKLKRVALEKGWRILDWKKMQPKWKVKLEKLFMLLFAVRFVSGSTSASERKSDAVQEGARAREYAPAHCLELTQYMQEMQHMHNDQERPRKIS